MSTRYLSYKSEGCLPRGSDEANEVLDLADAIEARLGKTVERLMDRGCYVVASSLLDRMVVVATELRCLVAGNPDTSLNDRREFR